MICRAANELASVRARYHASHPICMPRERLDAESDDQMGPSAQRTKMHGDAPHPLATSHTRIVRSRLALTIKSSFARYRTDEMEWS